MLRFGRLIIIGLLLNALITPIAAAARNGLVIANSRYTAGVGELPNAVKGAPVVVDALRRSQFSTPEPVTDASLARMREAIARHATLLRAGGAGAVGFVYFAGHGGADASQRNYIFPTDLSAAQLQRVQGSALALSEVMSMLREGAPDAEHVIVLDACRNELGAAGRSPEQAGRGGFSMPRDGELPAGMLLMFSTGAGRTAVDSNEFATFLAASIVRSNASIVAVFERLKAQMIEATGERQVPWYMSNLRQSLRLGHDVEVAASDVAFEATDKLGLQFVDRYVEAYRTADVRGGVVEIRARGAVYKAQRPDDIFLVTSKDAARWVSYQSLWGRVYVVADKVRLF